MKIELPPKAPPMETFSVRFPDLMVRWLDSHAAVAGCTRSDVLRLLIIAEIEREDQQ